MGLLSQYATRLKDDEQVRLRASSVNSPPIDAYTSASAGPHSQAAVVRRLDLPGFAEYMEGENSGDWKGTPSYMQVVWRIAFRMGALPIKVYSFGENGDRQEDSSHRAYNLLRQPNPYTPRNLMVNGTVASMLTQRKGYWLKRRDGAGRVVSLWPIPASLVTPLPSEDGTIPLEKYAISTKYGPTEVAERDMMFFRLMMDPNEPMEGVSPLQALTKAASVHEGSMDAMLQLYGEGFFEPLWIDLHGKELSPERQARLEAQMARARAKRGIPVMEGGDTLETLQVNATDQMFTRGEEAMRTMLMDAFWLPEGHTEADLRLFYSEVVQPVADAMELEMERSLMSEWPQKPAFPEFQFREVLKGTPAERIKAHRDAIFSLQETPDEARREENRPPLPDGIGAIPWGPLNVWPIEKAMQTDARPTKQTSGGFGGSQGQTVNPPQVDQSIGAGTPDPLKNVGRSAGTPTALLAGAYRARSGSYNTARMRNLDRLSQACANRMRGVLKKEAKALKTSLRAELPSLEELLAGTATVTNEAVLNVLLGFSTQMSDEAWQLAIDYIGGTNEAVAESMQAILQDRATAVVERFGEVRVERLTSLFDQALTEGWPTRKLAGEVGKLYEQLGAGYVDGIARTELAFAHEATARTYWERAGIERLEYHFGGGPCSTGMCEREAAESEFQMGQGLENVGSSFAGVEHPPLHPNCTCYVTPLIG